MLLDASGNPVSQKTYICTILDEPPTLEPEIMVFDDGVPFDMGRTLDFGTKYVGGQAISKTITVQNTGGSVLAVSQITAVPSGYSFTPIPGDGLSLDPSESTSFYHHVQRQRGEWHALRRVRIDRQWRCRRESFRV